MNPRACCAADHIVTIDGSGKRNAGVKVFRKRRRKLAQLFEREAVEFASFIKREPDRLADDVVRATKGNAAMGQVRGGSHSIEESVLCDIAKQCICTSLRSYATVSVKFNNRPNVAIYTF